MHLNQANFFAYLYYMQFFIKNQYNLEEKFKMAKNTLRAALAETDTQKQKIYRRMADTGEYWDKFASIAGKLYLLQHIDDMECIYQEGWHDFTARILDE